MEVIKSVLAGLGVGLGCEHCGLKLGLVFVFSCHYKSSGYRGNIKTVGHKQLGKCKQNIGVMYVLNALT